MMKHKREAVTVDSWSANSSGTWNPQELLAILDNHHAFLCELLEVYRRDSQTGLQEAKEELTKEDLIVVGRRAPHPERNDEESFHECCRINCKRSGSRRSPGEGRAMLRVVDPTRARNGRPPPGGGRQMAE
jgi:hypothetical protein